MKAGNLTDEQRDKLYQRVQQLLKECGKYPDRDAASEKVKSIRAKGDKLGKDGSLK